MKIASLPENENERLALLKSFDILDTPPESDYDDITKLASYICEMPISLITLIDEKRQWFKSKVGVDADSTPRELAFCAHNLSNPNSPLVVNDTTKDERFMDNPLVTGSSKAIFYAGVPLVTENGLALGSLCVIDNVPNKISKKNLDILKKLSNQVVKLIELRKANAKLKKSEVDLKIINQNLYDFAHVVSHDLKAPIRHVNQYVELIKDEVNEKETSSINHYLNKIEESSSHAMELIDGILRYSRSINSYDSESSNISLTKLIENIIDNYNSDNSIRCTACIEVNEITTSRVALSQILTNIISNAIKYNDKEDGFVKIFTSNDGDFYTFEIVDNGIGIPKDQLDSIFNLFYMVDEANLTHINRNGIGLNIVNKLVQNSGGKISVSSKYGKGSSFKFSIPMQK